MATLISQGGSSGTTRRCDARCYNAHGAKCKCICGGLNHGAGYQKAYENTVKMAEEMLESYAEKGAEFAKDILEQIKKKTAC